MIRKMPMPMSMMPPSMKKLVKLLMSPVGGFVAVMYATTAPMMISINPITFSKKNNPAGISSLIPTTSRLTLHAQGLF